jgi:hypothetical protein
MQGYDLKASFVIAAVWLIGITMYSIWEGPLVAEEGAHAGVIAVSEKTLAAEPVKHWKLPALWTHQRWGAD